MRGGGLIKFGSFKTNEGHTYARPAGHENEIRGGEMETFNDVFVGDARVTPRLSEYTKVSGSSDTAEQYDEI